MGNNTATPHYDQPAGIDAGKDITFCGATAKASTFLGGAFYFPLGKFFLLLRQRSLGKLCKAQTKTKPPVKKAPGSQPPAAAEDALPPLMGTGATSRPLTSTLGESCP